MAWERLDTRESKGSALWRRRDAEGRWRYALAPDGREPAGEGYLTRKAAREAASWAVYQVQGDGRWELVSRHRSERAAAREAVRLWEGHLATYGQALRHIETGRTVGAVRVDCPDGTTMDSMECSWVAQT